MSKTWKGDWKARVRSCACRIGFNDLWSFAQANPGIPFGQLFRLFREVEQPDDIPICYAQFQSVFFEDAESYGKLRDAIIDTLVRRIRQHLSKGWDRGKGNRTRKADVISQWEIPLEQYEKYSAITSEVWQRLKEKPVPDDWCPEDTMDPIIQEVFDEVWPVHANGK